MAVRDLQLTLLAAGGAELVDVETDETLWASDSDADFAEEFPEILDENDVEHLLDYLEGREALHLTARELELCDILNEPLDIDDCDDPEGLLNEWDEEEDDAEDGDGDVIEGEFEERE